jgi:hypothetical protein
MYALLLFLNIQACDIILVKLFVIISDLKKEEHYGEIKKGI